MQIDCSINTILLKDTWFVVVNPHAGSGKGKNDWPSIESLLKSAGLNFAFAFTEFKHHAVQITVDAIKLGYRRILAVGGDGTLNEVVNGIFIQKEVPSSEFVVGVVAVGTGNDWLRMYDFPPDYKSQIDILVNGSLFMQDIGLAEYYETEVKKSRYFVNSAGGGFDAEVVVSTNRLKDMGRKGKVLYILSLIKTLIHYRSTRVNISVDNFQLDEVVFSLSSGIGRYTGSGMKQVPFALTDDGLFDVTIIRKLSKLNVLASVPRLYNGKILDHSRTICVRGSDVKIVSNPPMSLEADGETLGHSPFHFSIIPLSIGIMVSSSFVELNKNREPECSNKVLLGHQNV